MNRSNRSYEDIVRAMKPAAIKAVEPSDGVKGVYALMWFSLGLVGTIAFTTMLYYIIRYFSK